MMTNILAPFVKTENAFKFYVNGRVFEMNDNTITETESIDSTLGNAIAAFESFEFSPTTVKWFHGASKFTYSLTENSFKVGDTVIENFTKHVLSSGLVRYENKNTADLFESLPTLVENFVNLDFAATFEGNNNIVNLFKIEEKVYVSRFNTTNKIAKFFEATNANAAVEFVNEQTGLSAITFLNELVTGQAQEIAQNEAVIKSYQDLVAFLKDQRGLLAEADKSIAEIKAADSLINEEILNWETKIAELQS
jgi:hypothetical protein